MVSGFILRFVIHFKLTFAYSERQQDNCILLHVAVSFSQEHLNPVQCVLAVPLRTFGWLVGVLF